MVNVYILPAFGRDDPKSITRNRIELWHGKLAQRVPVRANRCLAVLSSFLSWLEHDRRIDHNPCKGVRKRSESPRQVFLSAKEIAAAHKALKADNDRSAALTLRLTLLTGCRIGEALTLAPDQIDSARKVWVKPAAYVKTARTHIIPLQAEALDVAQELLDVGVPTYDGVRIALGARQGDHRPAGMQNSRSETFNARQALARAGASLVRDRRGARPHQGADDATLYPPGFRRPASIWWSGRDEQEARTAARSGRRALAARANGPAHGRRGVGGDAARGHIPSPGKANDRAARRLGISIKTLKRLLALAPAADPRDERS